MALSILSFETQMAIQKEGDILVRKDSHLVCIFQTLEELLKYFRGTQMLCLNHQEKLEE